MQYGHFDNEKREYVIDRVDLPVSWTNYLGVKDMCVVVNHTAGGYMERFMAAGRKTARSGKIHLPPRDELFRL